MSGPVLRSGNGRLLGGRPALLFSTLLHFLRRNDTRARLARARGRGVGVYTAEWPLDAQSSGVAEQIIDWCKETLARSRRPWGIAEFELALAFRGSGRERTNTLRIPAASPALLYSDDSGLVRQVRTFLADASVLTISGPILIAAVLCSWGDIAHVALVKQGQTAQ